MEALIVHLSDLHFKNDVENRKRLEYLISDLRRLRADGPIHTAFTGDLIQAGDQSEDYDLLFEELIMPLIEMGHEVHLVPGNHDVQRSVAEIDFIDSCLKDATSSYLFNKMGELVDPYPESKLDPLSKYRQLEQLLGPYDHSTYYGWARTRGAISVVGLNSAWLCRSRTSGDTDRGKLRIEPYILEGLAKNLPAGNLRIALMHHPLDWLEETTRDAVTKILTREFDMALFGHVHATDMTKLTHGGSDCLFAQSPPLRSNWSKGTNGYSVIRSNVDSKRFEIEYRSYSATRRSFVPGHDFAPEGLLHPRTEDRDFFQASPSEEFLSMRYNDAMPFDYTAWHRGNIRAKSRKFTSFSTPKARRVTLDQEKAWLEAAESITTLVAKSNRDQYFIAPPDAGVTTAGFITFKHLSETFIDHGRIPAFFDANEHKINKASILREANRTILANYSHAEVERLADKGSLCIVVDGLSLSDVEQFNLFKQTAEKFFPTTRFIYFLTTERRGAVISDAITPDLNPETDEIFDFAEMEVGDIRGMVADQRPNASAREIDIIVAQVVESFRQMDEPIYASSVAVVVETLSQDPEFKPINKARLLERYVECLLGRFDLEDVREGTFASSDRIDLLSYMAHEMLTNRLSGIDEGSWGKLCYDYSERYLIDLPRNLLDEFIEKGILTVSAGKITFRADYLFSFFVARQMKADPSFSDFITQGEAIFTYHKEIAFYGDLEGTDNRPVLNAIQTALDSLQAQLEQSYREAGIEIHNEWPTTCTEVADATASMDAFSNAKDGINGTEPTPEQADRYSDHQLSEVIRARGVLERQDVREAEARLLISMKLYALLLKNSIQVPAEEKLHHLRSLFSAAEFWVGFLCAMRREIISKPLVVVGGVRILNTGAVINPERSARDFKYNAPNSISRILSELLRNPQLGIALRRVMPSLTSMGALFARDAILELPSADNRTAYVSSLVNEEDVNLVTSSLRTLRMKYLISGRNSEKKGHIEHTIEAISKTAQVKGRLNFDELKKARILKDLREQSRDRNSQSRAID